MKESIFTPEAGARRGIPKVLVVLTDGRSQDDVNKVSKEMQMDGGYFIDPTEKVSGSLVKLIIVDKVTCVCWRPDPHSPSPFSDALCYNLLLQDMRLFNH